MTDRDRQRLFELISLWDDNKRFFELCSAYLVNCPELIEKRTVEALTEGGAFTVREALVALLSSAFGLDYDNRDDRRIIREYLEPSVRILDKSKYENDPYFKRIPLSDISRKGWEIRIESYPAYRAVIAADLAEAEGRHIPPIGFFEEEFKFPAVLEDGNEWMTLTPVDTDTVREDIERAHGRVVTFGLGLGYYAFMVSERECVEEITVVEKSEDVIELFKEYVLPYFPHKEKVRIINADAFEYAAGEMVGERYDIAFVDTWRDASDGAPMYLRMKALEHLHPETSFSYWVEGFIRSRIKAYKLSKMLEKLDTGAADAPKSYEEALAYIEDFSDVSPLEMEP